MQCGHCFCIECIRIVVDRYSFGGRHRTVKCAVCRQSSLHAEISYVTTSGGQSSEDEAALRVKVGLYSLSFGAKTAAEPLTLFILMDYPIHREY